MLKTILGYIFPDFNSYFLGSLLKGASSLLGGVLGGAASSIGQAGGNFIGGLFNDKDGNPEDVRNTKAGGQGDNTSIPEPESWSHKAGEGLRDFGVKMAGDFTTQLSSMFINDKITSMFAPSGKDMARDARRRAQADTAYTDRRYPGVSKWDLLGRGGASPGQGGSAAAATAAEGARRVSSINQQPNLKRVELEYQKTAPQIDQIKADTAHKTGQAVNVQKINEWQSQLTRAQTTLAQRGSDKSMAEAGKVREETKLTVQKLVTEIQNSGIAENNKTISKALAEVASWLAAGKVAAPLIGGIGGLIWALKSLTGMKGKSKYVNKPYGKIHKGTGVITGHK